MNQIVNNPGLQHVIENVFLNLDFEGILSCQFINQSCHELLENPIFWLKKWRLRGLSKKNQEDWVKAIQMTRNTNFEKNVDLYIKKIIQYGHFVDVPCYINNNVLEKATRSNIGVATAFQQKDAGILQLLVPLNENWIDLIEGGDGWTPIHFAAFCTYKEHIEVIKVLAPLMKNPNSKTQLGNTPIMWAALGSPDLTICQPWHAEVVKFLAPLTDNPNAPNKNQETPIDVAAKLGNNEIVRILKTYVKNQ